MNCVTRVVLVVCFFFQAEDGIRDYKVTGVQTCALPISSADKKYDLITSYLTCFHRLERLRNGNWQTWSSAEWQFFIDDVRAHQLAEGGQIGRASCRERV